MKKGLRIFIYIVLWYILFFICYYLLKEAIKDNSIYAWVVILVPVTIVFGLSQMNEIIINKKYSNIKNISDKYKALCELNKKYTFNELGTTNRVIIEREYSHKSFDRARANSIILYQIENNEDNIREFILNAYRNKKLYDNYLNEFSALDVKTSEEKINSAKYSVDKFIKLENKVIESEKIKDNVYNITIKVIVSYITPSGRSEYKKDRVMTYQELCDLYMQWRNGKKYDETSKRERKYMTDQLRYDVMKRDNFTCQKCGATAKDGAKLQVDHIVPVYKGGKTTLSNLQTLCDRCNKGKGIKDN